MNTQTERRSWIINTTADRASLIEDALNIAINSLEFDGEHDKAELMAKLLQDIKDDSLVAELVSDMEMNVSCGACGNLVPDLDKHFGECDLNPENEEVN